MSFWGKLFNKSGDKWVFIGSNDSITDYYDPTSIKIYKDPPSCITVSCKRVYTNKGKQMLFDHRESQGLKNNKLKDIHHTLNSYNLYYKEGKKTLLVITHVSKSNEILEMINMMESGSFPTIDDIKPGTVDEIILNKLIKDYNIQINEDCDDYVYIWSDDKITMYYIKSSVEIDNQFKTIKVLVKRLYTEKGIVDFLKTDDRIDKHKLNNFNHTLLLYFFDYKEWKLTITNLTQYSKSGDVLSEEKYPIKFMDIIPNSIGEGFLNKLLKDYNIQR